jgi:F-type H+-transporting ATPase subunit b
MDSLIGTFHIDWKLILAQVVNFGIVFFVLYRFAIKPLGRVMDERKETMKKGLDDAKRHATLAEEAETLYNEELAKARIDAQALVKEMKTEVGKEKEIMLQQASADAQKILTEGRKALQDEKHHMIEEVEKEIAKLVVLATEKVLSGVTNPKLNEEIVISSIRESEQ